MSSVTPLPARIACAALMVAVLAVPARAQDETGGMPGEWLSRYSSARSLGLGGAFVAVADDPLGVLWNPAGLSVMDQNRLSFETARMFPDKVAATVIYYGQVSSERSVLEPLKMPILGIFAGQDEHITAESARAFEKALHQLGKEAEVSIYEGVGHAFANPSGTAYRKVEAEDAWQKTLTFLDKHLNQAIYQAPPP